MNKMSRVKWQELEDAFFSGDLDDAEFCKSKNLNWEWLRQELSKSELQETLGRKAGVNGQLKWPEFRRLKWPGERKVPNLREWEENIRKTGFFPLFQEKTEFGAARWSCRVKKQVFNEKEPKLLRVFTGICG